MSDKTFGNLFYFCIYEMSVILAVLAFAFSAREDEIRSKNLVIGDLRSKLRETKKPKEPKTSE